MTSWLSHSDSFDYITQKHSIDWWPTEDKLRRFCEEIKRLNKMTDQNLGWGDNQFLPSRGKVRGLLTVWVETGIRKDRIWISASPNPGHGRVATLALLSKMMAQNATRAPGIRNSHPMGRGLADINSNINDPFPSMGRARSRNPSSFPSVEPPLCPHTLGLSACVGVGALSMPHPVLSVLNLQALHLHLDLLL